MNTNLQELQISTNQITHLNLYQKIFQNHITLQAFKRFAKFLNDINADYVCSIKLTVDFMFSLWFILLL